MKNQQAVSIEEAACFIISLFIHFKNLQKWKKN